MNIEKKLIDSFVEAEKSLKIADHLIYAIYPAVKDNKLLLRALESCNKSAIKIISFILKYEYLHKRISLSKDNSINLETFFSKCKNRYSLSEMDEKLIRDLLKITKKHKESPFEFSQREKIVIMVDSGNVFEIKNENLVEFIKVIKHLIEHSRKVFLKI